MLRIVMLAAAMLSAQDVPAASSHSPAAKPRTGPSAPAAVRAPAARGPVSGYALPPAEARVPLEYAAINDRVLFRATVGGREVWALLDNGADVSLIDLGLIASLGLESEPAGFAVHTQGGSLGARRVRDVRVAIAGQFDTRMALVGVDMAPASSFVLRPIQFVLGADILARFALTVDPDARTFQLAPSGTAAVPAGAPSIAVRDRRALIDIQVNGKPVTVGLDMGSNGGLSLTPAAWKRVGGQGVRRGSSTATGAGGHSYSVELVEAPEVVIGHRKLEKVEIHLMDLRRGAAGEGIVGMAILADYRIVLDIGGGRLWLLSREPRTERGMKGF